MSDAITCFKAYDARGKVPDELNADIAYRVARDGDFDRCFLFDGAGWFIEG